MGSLNKVQIIGNLGRDPEVRQTSDGRNIASVSVGTTDKWKDKSGEAKERTEWIRVVVFGKLADVVSKYLKKGSSVYFEGRLQTRKYTNKDGQEVYTTEVVLDQRGSMQMLGGAKSNGNSDSSYQDSLDAQAPSKYPDEAAFDDSIPF